MALNKEWADRLKRWREELPHHFYRRLGALKLSGFVTTEQLTAQQAKRRRMQPMPPGHSWGGKWEYGWFRTRVKTPKEAAGQRLVAYLTDRESLAWINGELATGQRSPTTLARRARPGQVLDVLVEAYAGHGPTVCSIGPVPLDRPSVPEPPARQAVVPEAHFGIWQEEVYQLYFDLETVAQSAAVLEDSSLRVAELEDALRDVTLILDFELPREEFMATVAAARRRLAKVLSARNGTTAPTHYCFGHAHLDTAWLWPVAHVQRKAARTVSNQLELAAEYPHHRFLMSQPAQWQWIKDLYPSLWKRMVKAVRWGNFIPDGAMWVEADTNIPSGESLIRQMIHGKRFFREHFGVDSKLLWLPDVFGYPASLPQMMAGCGVRWFSTSKLFWLYHGGDPFPYNAFQWEGIDGTRVLTFLFEDYNSRLDPASMARRWNTRRQHDGLKSLAVPFGYGDGGGGPQREHFEFARRQKDLQGLPRLVMATPERFFADLQRQGTRNHYVGELYYQNHRGTYTSQARVKRANRKAELALREAEFWGAAAAADGNFAWPAAKADAIWKAVLINQFHDIIPGSSIRRVYEEAEAQLAEAIADADAIRVDAQSSLLNRGSGAVTVLNSLNWDRTELVELPPDMPTPRDAAGNALPTQQIGKATLAEVRAPACGWTTIASAEPGSPAAMADVGGAVAATPKLLENELLRVKFNASGEITSIYDKLAQRELAGGVCNRLMLFKDTPTQYDAWDIDSMYELQPVKIAAAAKVAVVAAGPLAGVLRVNRDINGSAMTQQITLRRGSRRIDFATVVDWRQRRKLLKVAFPLAVVSDEAVHEIQFGHIRRPTHRSRPYDADRFEVCAHKWTALCDEAGGGAVLNDCKYGVSVLGSSINLTLLRAPIAPDMQADQGRQEFTYSFFAFEGPLAASGVVRAAYELNCPVTTAAGDGGEGSIFRTSAPGIIIDTVKPAEDGSGDIIVRMYESLRARTRCRLATALPVASASQCNMLEEPQRPLTVSGGAMKLDFRAFEIKTLRLKLR